MPISGYLVDVVTRERLGFQFNPSTISDDKSATYVDITIPGISHPRHQYIAGGGRRIALKLSFFAEDITAPVAWLQSLLYAEHSGNTLKAPPHRVLFVFGELYPDLMCIVKNVKVRYMNLFNSETLIPKHAEVDLTLDEWIEESVNYKTIRG